ncbi:MAG: lycopene cyclase [Saprospiraceae bacterium]|nr:lycopene cyclase [Saprospiraceae bacterium]
MVYDYAIIGAGAAGLQLALAMTEDAFFADKNILILEPDSKVVNDKTWSFWEKGRGKYDDILFAAWDTALFYGGGKQLELPLGEYQYKTLRAIDFYNYAKGQFQKNSNITWISEEVVDIKEGDYVNISAQNQYTAQYVFDSRLTISLEALQRSNGVLQHFLGWEIKAMAEVFDPNSFTMMDYRLKYGETASFTYVLPSSKTKALVEFTFFSPDPVEKEEYEQMLGRYIAEHLQVDKYSIEAVEQGVIPMFDYPFHSHSTDRIIKIGTAGGWVKASSGYSFKSSGNKCKRLVENIKKKKPLTTGLYSKRHALYDSTFLKVLEKENHLGEDIFTIMYSENDIETVFAFLDEETSFLQEVGLMNTLPKAKFGKAMASVVLSLGRSA